MSKYRDEALKVFPVKPYVEGDGSDCNFRNRECFKMGCEFVDKELLAKEARIIELESALEDISNQRDNQHYGYAKRAAKSALYG